MADIKKIVKQMKDAGMSYPDILTNLQELGIADAEKQLSVIVDEIEAEEKKSGKKATGGGESLHVTKIEGEEEREVDIGDIGSGSSGEPLLMKRIPKTNLTNPDDVEEKLDQIIALLKSLHEVNKKILESNRDLMVKLEKKTSNKPTVEKLF